jgi:hypothetical protein
MREGAMFNLLADGREWTRMDAMDANGRQWATMGDNGWRTRLFRAVSVYLDLFSDYFPIQNWWKIESSRSSVAVWPTISPTAWTAVRRSTATKSSGTPLRSA